MKVDFALSPENEFEPEFSSYVAETVHAPKRRKNVFPSADEVLQLLATKGTPQWQDAQVSLIKSMTPYVTGLAIKFSSTSGIPVDDFLQNGKIGVLAATSAFDPSRGFRFSTYAGTAARNEMVMLFRDKSPRLVQMPENSELANNIEDGASPIEDQVQTRRDIKTVHEVLSRMTPKYRLALVRKFGIGNNVESSLRKFSVELGMEHHGSAGYVVEQAMKEFRRLLKNPAK